MAWPSAVDFFGDQIESIKKFDLDTLGSGETLQSIRVMDLKGQLPETSGSTHLFSYLDPETVVVLWAPLEIAEQAKSYLDRLPDERGIYPLASLLQQAGNFPRLELSQFDQGTTAMPTLVGGQQVPSIHAPRSDPFSTSKPKRRKRSKNSTSFRRRMT